MRPRSTRPSTLPSFPVSKFKAPVGRQDFDGAQRRGLWASSSSYDYLFADPGGVMEPLMAWVSGADGPAGRRRAACEYTRTKRSSGHASRR